MLAAEHQVVRHSIGDQMARQLIPLEGRTFAGVRYERESETWVFSFFGGIVLRVDAAWRVRMGTRILLGWRDDGQRFGKDASVDLAAEVSAAFELAPVTSAEASDESGDLRVSFANGAALELFNDSGGYEGWELNHARGGTIAQGGGRVVDV